MSDDEQREAAEAGWREAADDAVYDHRNRPFTVELLKAWFGSGVDVGWDAAMAAKAEPVQTDREALLTVVDDAIERWADLYPTPQVAEYVADAVIAHLAAQQVIGALGDVQQLRNAQSEVKAAQPVTGTSRQQVVLYEVYESDGEPWLFTSDKAAALKALTHAADAGDGGDSYMVERAWGPREA